MSQGRSSRGAKAKPNLAKPARPSGRSSANRQVPPGRGTRGGQQPAKSDIFVLLLGVAFGAMVLGSLFLVLHWNRYGFQTGGPG